MPRSCSICTHPNSAEITRQIGQGVSIRSVASRYGFKHHAAVHRHKVACMGIAPQRRAAAPAERTEAVHTSRIDPSDPNALLAAQAQLVNQALDVAEHAVDHRTQLAAIREARDGLTVLMRSAGLLQSDGATTIDNRTQILALKDMSLDELRGLAALGAGKPALPPSDVIDAEVRSLGEKRSQGALEHASLPLT
jgi:hypothetical protein